MIDKKYLPSKEFQTRIAIIVVLLLVVFGLYKSIGWIKTKAKERKTAKVVVVKDIVQKDSNANGIPDWEESLWGLDPDKDGEENKQFILAKRALLSKENSDEIKDDETGEINAEDNSLAMAFFSIIMSLNESGTLNENSMAVVSDALGKKIEALPINPIYTTSNIKISKTSDVDGYLTNIAEIMSKYDSKSIGDELNFVAQGLLNKDKQVLYLVGKIGEAYQSLGKDIINVPVPKNMEEIHLALANDYYRVGKTVVDLSKILESQTIGMKAIINYKKYSDSLYEDIDSLYDF